MQRKVNLPPRAGGAVALIIWYALMCVLAVIQYNGLVIAGAMVIGYIFIIRNIYMLSKELDEAGYSIQTVSIKVTDRCIAPFSFQCLSSAVLLAIFSVAVIQWPGVQWIRQNILK